METRQHKLLRYLNDSYAAEMGGVASLKDLAAVTTDPELKQVVLDHMEQTKYQADRLANRIKALGGDKSEAKALVDSVIAKGSSFTNIGHDRADKQTQDLIKAYALEHFEVGTYTSLYTYANAIGDYETAALADEIRAEEEMAAQQLQRFIPQVARLALNNASTYTPAPKRGWNKAITPALWLSGAALAAWGVSKLLSNGSEGMNGESKPDTNFGTARTGSTDTLASSASTGSSSVGTGASTATLSPDVAEAVSVNVSSLNSDAMPSLAGYNATANTPTSEVHFTTRTSDDYDVNAETRPVTGSTSGSSSSSSI